MPASQPPSERRAEWRGIVDTRLSYLEQSAQEIRAHLDAVQVSLAETIIKNTNKLEQQLTAMAGQVTETDRWEHLVYGILLGVGALYAAVVAVWPLLAKVGAVVGSKP